MDTTSTIREILDHQSEGKRYDTCLIGKTKLSPNSIVTLSHEMSQTKDSARCLRKLPFQMGSDLSRFGDLTKSSCKVVPRLFSDICICLNRPIVRGSRNSNSESRAPVLKLKRNNSSSHWFKMREAAYKQPFGYLEVQQFVLDCRGLVSVSAK